MVLACWGTAGAPRTFSASLCLLIDDSFATIAKAVKEGRGVYDNLRKILMFALPTNGAQVCTVVVLFPSLVAGLSFVLDV
jgi:magnesium-transporting ATPase (P-type)